MGGKNMNEKINNKNNNMTMRLQKLVKKRKTDKVVIKAGTLKRPTRSTGGSIEDYAPSYSDNT